MNAILKVLIVDDEPLVRIGVKATIPWAQLELELVGEAADGKEALALVRRTHPDIILLDIAMPVMDGIEFLERFRAEGHTAQILILSCHNEFEYVKQAMKLGAFDYILKLSMGIDDLTGQLRQMKELAGRSHAPAPALPASPVADYLEQYLRREPDPHAQAAPAVGAFRRALDQSAHRILLLEICGETAQDHSACRHIAAEVFTNLYGGHSRWHTFQGAANQGYYVLPCPDETRCGQVCQRLVTALRAYSNTECLVGVSAPFTGEGQLYPALRQSQDALLHRFYDGGAPLFLFDRLPVFQADCLIRTETEREIAQALDMRDFSTVRALVSRILDQYAQDKQPHPRVALGNFIEITSVFVQHLKKSGLRLVDISPQYEHFFEILLAMQTCSQLRALYQQFLYDFQAFADSHSRERSRSDIQAAQRYLEENYRLPCHLEDVAQVVNMSKNYFSHLFKKETGVSFVTYLNDVRIRQAIRLLRTEQYKIYEVADMVGFNNPNYFYKLFKKHTGRNPNEFKK